MTIALATKGVIIPQDITIIVESEVKGAYAGDGQAVRAYSNGQRTTGAFVKEC